MSLNKKEQQLARKKTYREAPNSDTAHKTMLRAQRKRFEDIRAAPDAPVDRDLDAALGHRRAGPQSVQSGGRVVELAAAVVGDDDAVDGVLDGELDVGGMQDWGIDWAVRLLVGER